MSQQQSAACCSTPPIVTKGYKEKGSYTTIGGVKTYKTGPDNATKAIVVVFDIFGYFEQTLQGADILATGDSEQSYQVFIPDLLDGKPLPIDTVPPDNEEKKNRLGEFFGGRGAPPENVKKLESFTKALQSEHKFQKTGVLGFCWGGKVVNLASGKNTLFNAAATGHPAMVDPEDAKNITIPTALLASQDEDADAVSKFEAALTVPKLVESYPDQIHGWMAARSDLSDPKVVKGYEKAYKSVLDFFHQHL